MRTSVGESQILHHRVIFQLLTTSDRFFEHLESLFLNARSLSDDFLLRQGRGASWRYHPCRPVVIDGFSSELLDARWTQANAEHDWFSRFGSADAIIFVVPLSAYCQASASLVSERSTLSCSIVS